MHNFTAEHKGIKGRKPHQENVHGFSKVRNEGHWPPIKWHKHPRINHQSWHYWGGMWDSRWNSQVGTTYDPDLLLSLSEAAKAPSRWWSGWSPAFPPLTTPFWWDSGGYLEGQCTKIFTNWTFVYFLYNLCGRSTPSKRTTQIVRKNWRHPVWKGTN